MRAAAAALLVWASAGLVACEREAPRASVLLITLDTTRADHLGVYGATRARTPHLDALAAQGIVYERAYSPAPITLPAHASLMTGLYPFEHGVRNNGSFRLGEAAQTLAEVLRDHGYRTGAVVGAFVLDRRFGLAQGFDSYDDAIPSQPSAGAFGFAERQAPAVTDAALDWLSEASERPFFLWLHYFDPHAAYDSHGGDRALFGLLPYDAEIAFVDREIGRLLEGLPEAPHGAGTLIVVAADHGEGLWEHGEISHGTFVYDSTLRAALILKLPDGAHAGGAISAPASLVDVFPTVLGLLGIPAGNVSGVPLPTVEPGTERPSRSIYFENHAVAYSFGLHPLRGVVRGFDKWIDAPRPERYELGGDPRELENRAGTDDPVSGELRAAMMRLLDDRSRVLPRDAGTTLVLEPTAAARLRSLGYLPHAAASASDALPTGPDPKDAAEDVREILAAEALIEVGRRQQAAEKLAAVVQRSDFVNPRAITRLAALATQPPGRETAIAALLPYLDRDLEPALRFALAARLGIALGRSGRYHEAVRAYEIAAQLEPTDAEVRRGLESARRLGASASELGAGGQP